MIQILSTKIPTKSSKKKFVFLFLFSILALFIIFFIYTFMNYNNYKAINYSNIISKNYEIYKLYSYDDNSQIKFETDTIAGKIIIPTLNINYPFFYGINDNLLKLGPCRFLGKLPPEKSNLCIAGHNYNDSRFFSKIPKLKYNDQIIIQNMDNKNFIYRVYSNFEIDENQINLVTKNSVFYNELTLVTCNNINKKRIIIKAKNESLE